MHPLPPIYLFIYKFNDECVLIYSVSIIMLFIFKIDGVMKRADCQVKVIKEIIFENRYFTLYSHFLPE